MLKLSVLLVLHLRQLLFVHRASDAEQAASKAPYLFDLTIRPRQAAFVRDSVQQLCHLHEWLEYTTLRIPRISRMLC